MKCHNPKCPEDAVLLYTWPGESPQPICADHASMLLRATQTARINVPMEPIPHIPEVQP